MSWRHFAVGRDHLARARSRRRLDTADATSVAHAKEGDRRDWFRRERTVARED